jgi:hypothetical protein
MMKWILFLFLGSSLSGATAQAASCTDLLLRPVLSLRNDNLGFFAQRVLRPVDLYDLSLIRESYLRAESRGPVEMGLVELLDRNGHSLARLELQGYYGTMGSGMNRMIETFLGLNARHLGRASALQIRHTHPTEFQGSQVSCRKQRFSKGDRIEDQKLRRILDSSEETRHLRIRSWIVFLCDEPGSPFGSEAALRDVRTRGYEL